MLTPEGMFAPVPYHHVSIGTGARQVHVQGRNASDLVPFRRLPQGASGARATYGKRSSPVNNYGPPMDTPRPLGASFLFTGSPCSGLDKTKPPLVG